IDETRFAYVKYGWEWIADAGICNAETGETLSIGGGMLPVAFRDGVLYLVQSGYDAPADLFAYDISSGELRKLITPENIEDICYITPAAAHIFYLTPNFEGEGSAELRVYSREGELRETHILECRGSTIQYIAALSHGCVLVYGEAYYGRHFLIYTLT
ncbi:MAG: hypothetical protein IKL99_06395, partial [Oscillospiraceae bacterium]|nr:hypothetical protein [Oscillospiraceae bacterium]